MTLREIKKALTNTSAEYLLDPDDTLGEEYAHFYFYGDYKGKRVVFDALLYTLRLQHESEVFEIAEEKASRQFPAYKKLQEEVETEFDSDLEEEIGLFMAEVIQELEEEEAVKVKEHVDFDESNEFGIGLDIGLNVDKVTLELIERFIKDFRANKLTLDDMLYSFQTYAGN
jgi:hypothetical protein